MPSLSTRITTVKPSASMAIADEARRLRSSGVSILDLSLGEPDFPTPGNVRDAGITAIRQGFTRYDSAAGTVALREAICGKLKRENDLNYTPADISVGCGAKQIISSALFVTLDAGDEVIIPAPYWTSYPEMVRLAGGAPVIIDCSSDQNFKLQPAALEAAITPRTKWVMLNSPHNPTGALYSEAELRGLAKVLRPHQHVGVISDEIYEHMTFRPNVFRSLAAVDEELFPRVLTVNGLSKAFAMTGWRVGYGAGERSLIRAINTFQSQTTTHTSTISQYAAVEALNGAQEERVRHAQAMSQKAQLTGTLVRATPGLTHFAPAGAFYCFVGCHELIGKTSNGKILDSDTAVAQFLLDEARVAVVPGEAYGAPGYLRISFATSESELRAAFRRIQDVLGTLAPLNRFSGVALR
jgi:aspartate aminotransferase